MNLEHEIMGTFKERRDAGGTLLNPSPLDGYHYCAADEVELGGDGYTRGEPNRISVAAFMADPAYLTLYGAKDPARALAKMRESSIRLTDAFG